MGLAYGEKGERVVEFQKGLLALEFALPRYGADGDYGGETLVAARAAAATFGIPMPTKDVPPALFAVITSRCPAAPSPGLTLGAWCGAKTLANPTRDIDTAVDLGLNRIDLVVNDHSAWRKPSHFSLRDHSKIMKVAQLARDAGLELNLMSWVMPHEAYIREAAVDLIPLARETGAASIQWGR
jgi:hypothetical protein